MDEVVINSIRGALRTAPDRLRAAELISAVGTALWSNTRAPLDHFDQCFVTGPARPIGLASKVRRERTGLMLTTAIPANCWSEPGRAI